MKKHSYKSNVSGAPHARKQWQGRRSPCLVTKRFTSIQQANDYINKKDKKGKLGIIVCLSCKGFHIEKI